MADYCHPAKGYACFLFYIIFCNWFRGRRIPYFHENVFYFRFWNEILWICRFSLFLISHYRTFFMPFCYCNLLIFYPIVLDIPLLFLLNWLLYWFKHLIPLYFWFPRFICLISNITHFPFFVKCLSLSLIFSHSLFWFSVLMWLSQYKTSHNCFLIVGEFYLAFASAVLTLCHVLVSFCYITQLRLDVNKTPLLGFKNDLLQNEFISHG